MVKSEKGLISELINKEFLTVHNMLILSKTKDYRNLSVRVSLADFLQQLCHPNIVAAAF
jgi:hypothetical protein